MIYKDLAEFMELEECPDIQMAVEALEDGELLGRLGISQEESEELHYEAQTIFQAQKGK